MHLRLAIEAAQVAMWRWEVGRNRFTMDARAFALWGLDWAREVDFEDLSAKVHPSDRDRVREAFLATRAVEGPFEIDFRIMIEDEVRWVSARGVGADASVVDGATYGVFLDVTGRKQAEESNELLAGEMSHRVKNLLSVAMSLTHMSVRSAGSVEEMAQGLTARLSALGRAHDIVRPLPGEDGRAALLGDLLSVLLAPYDDQGAFAGRVRVAVPRIGVGERSTTTLAIMFHELATNAAKYGALSASTGTLDVAMRAEEEQLVLTWSETGGPAVAGPPAAPGTGLRMVERTLLRQFGGTLHCEWPATGLVATMTLRRDRLAV
ncbi:sensor histidine kinase [Polymorphobacter sp.]|uniref:sensor histidine kinase n=1 Tax=Polymorphobacter sp. TaxID=1909290 RepID=UPI003F7195E1